MQVSDTKGRDKWMAERELMGRDLCKGRLVSFPLKKEKVKSLRNLVFTSQRNTTPSADLYLRINVN